jgi:Mn2+/Fe2+ NRAMP family transporter
MPILKLLTMSLFAYVATVFVVDVPWREVLSNTIMPSISFKADYAVAVVAVFGTTISPYLFFWQGSQEVEEQRAADGEEPLKEAPEQAEAHLNRIKIDTYIGMGFSNLIAFFIMLTAAVTLNSMASRTSKPPHKLRKHRTDSGEFAFLLFSAGIVGTGLLSIPILAGSAAYAVAESSSTAHRPWDSSLWRQRVLRHPDHRHAYGSSATSSPPSTRLMHCSGARS